MIDLSSTSIREAVSSELEMGESGCGHDLDSGIRGVSIGGIPHRRRQPELFDSTDSSSETGAPQSPGNAVVSP